MTDRRQEIAARADGDRHQERLGAVAESGGELRGNRGDHEHGGGVVQERRYRHGHDEDRHPLVGSTGSTIATCSSPSATYRPQRLRHRYYAELESSCRRGVETQGISPPRNPARFMRGFDLGLWEMAQPSPVDVRLEQAVLDGNPDPPAVIRHTNPEHARIVLVDWTLGNSCNFACSYCPSNLHNGSMRWQPPELVKAFFAKLHSHYVEQLGRRSGSSSPAANPQCTRG